MSQYYVRNHGKAMICENRRPLRYLYNYKSVVFVRESTVFHTIQLLTKFQL